ncbi:hypothetical protein ACTWP4_07755 [Gracilibacillus sp. D59]|uniref:hypothetical protein n=1 Tax=Gracilibacillus sp. D59 TaxID=3457434 RepID=UPI003FCDAF3B
MDVVKDIIFSEWQWVTVFLSVIAFTAMIVGRYPLKTTLKSGIIAVFINFVAVSFFIYFSVSSDQTYPSDMATPPEDIDVEQRLSEVFENNKERVQNKELVALVQPITENDNVTSHVFVKNFHNKWEFRGKVRVAIYDDNGNAINDEVFDITLKPGEQKQIDTDFGDPYFDSFRYEFFPEEN